jgi:hypothetical protein
LRLNSSGLGVKGWNFSSGRSHVVVEEHQAGEIHGAVAAKDLVLVELEVHAQPLHNLQVGAGLNLQPHRVALAAVVQLHANRLQQRSRLFLLEVEVGVARHAERR